MLDPPPNPFTEANRELSKRILELVKGTSPETSSEEITNAIHIRFKSIRDTNRRRGKNPNYKKDMAKKSRKDQKLLTRITTLNDSTLDSCSKKLWRKIVTIDMVSSDEDDEVDGDVKTFINSTLVKSTSPKSITKAKSKQVTEPSKSKKVAKLSTSKQGGAPKSKKVAEPSNSKQVDKSSKSSEQVAKPKVTEPTKLTKKKVTKLSNSKQTTEPSKSKKIAVEPAKSKQETSTTNKSKSKLVRYLQLL
ncbi:transcriptional regulator ATRX homolog [Clytia hemisphaerica]|uniref:transcriptional regulator ATRX homolog n=1 Tax=Clytia hemisphaerica TaxID=252671 RepID=UPI0034D707E8